ncbi:hypothetical protein GCM10011332_30740 [Terasakiella brassicae]|uniref:Tyr recombinase domain-containing protein n=1 Tax=Terasakiella brassicae TaxID=1634917 RepID=A0A917C6K8_9PROT|nr:integrase family protein [Terasakiella brassicae]GGF74470.1 hypothetical protein GCM10011332_30740 [Terasakiella brassicae]
MAPRKNKLKLTNAIIPRLESSYTWDTEVNQFGCRYFPKSGKRTFILRYRGINRKQREFRIGVFPAMSVTTARDTAKRLIGQIMLGNDPQHQRKLKMHQAITFADVVDAYVIWASQNAKKNSIGEIDTFTRIHIKPRFGDQYICDMTTGLVQRVYDKSITKLSISYTNKMIDWARTIWNWGKKREMVEGENPFIIVRKKTRRRRKRILKPSEFSNLWQAIENNRYRGTICNVSLNAIEMFILTPLRKTEIYRLRWMNVCDQENMIRVTDHKTDHLEPDIELFITAPLRELLDGMPRTRTGWLFPSPKSESGHIEDIDSAWKTIRKEAGISDCTMHDMRRSWNSIGASLGHSPAEMAQVIGNSTKVNEEHYWHLLEDYRREISEKVADKIVSFRK